MNLSDALLIIDLQNGVCFDKEDIYNLKHIIKTTNQRIAQYNSKNLPIIFIQHDDDELVKGSFEWEIIPSLNLSGSSYFIGKKHANAFYNTDLNQLLMSLSIKSIEVCGAQTQYCVDSTVKFAHGLGYQLRMISGMTSTYSNDLLNAHDIVTFYEQIWNCRFVEFIDI